MIKHELSEKELKKREWMYQNLKRGVILKGKIKKIKPYGVFIDIGNGISRSFIYRRYICSKN